MWVFASLSWDKNLIVSHDQFSFLGRLEASPHEAPTMYFSRGKSLDRSCAKERWKCVASLYAGGKSPFKVNGVSKL